MVMLEVGFTWLPAYLWRLHKFWRGIRMETPWVDRAPLEIVRSNIRFSLQPVDAPPDPATLNRLFDHMQSDELLLFSTDYPHWQFDGDEVLPPGSVARSCSQDHDRQSARDIWRLKVALLRTGT
jgi:predicted TIM-barrel fold metal-dependent hydrolase